MLISVYLLESPIRLYNTWKKHFQTDWLNIMTLALQLNLQNTNNVSSFIFPSLNKIYSADKESYSRFSKQ